MSNPKNENPFKAVMIPALLMGVLAHVFMGAMFALLSFYDLLLSVLVCVCLFYTVFLGVKRNKISSSKQVWLFIVIMVMIETFVYTYFLGWDTGFYYYLLTLPFIFILNDAWKAQTVVLLNLMVVAFSGFLIYFTYTKAAIYPIESTIKEGIAIINMISSFSVFIVVIVYFRNLTSKRNNALLEANRGLGSLDSHKIEAYQSLEFLVKRIHFQAKNNLETIHSLLSIDASETNNEEVIAALEKNKRRIEVSTLMNHSIQENNDFYRIYLNDHLEDVLRKLRLYHPKLRYILKPSHLILNSSDAFLSGLLLYEMITYSIEKLAKKDTRALLFRVEALKINESIELSISSDDIELSEDFDWHQSKSNHPNTITTLAKKLDAEITCDTNSGFAFKIVYKDSKE